MAFDEIDETGLQQVNDSMKMLMGELNNFQDIARYVTPLPGKYPRSTVLIFTVRPFRSMALWVAIILCMSILRSAMISMRV